MEASRRTRKGLFVTFEGTEGAGKSTLIRHVRRELRKRGLTVEVTREPGGTPVSERIRRLLLTQGMEPVTELLLYEAARAEHVDRRIRPALSRGAIVLCDRFTDSTLAYQSHARGLDWSSVKAANGLATRGLKPDLTVLLDVSPRKGLARVKRPNRFEAEGVRFQEKVRRGFRRAMDEAPRRWLRLRADGKSPDELARSVVEELVRRGAR